MTRLQVIAADLDGTLLDSNSKVDALTESTLREIDGMGLHLVLATGRHYLEARELQSALRIRAHLITSNGARAHAPDGAQLFAQDVDPAIARALLRPELTGDMLFGTFGDDGWLLCRPCPALDSYSKAFGLVPVVHDLASHHGAGLSKIAYMGTPDAIARLGAEILERFGASVSLTSTTARTLEVMSGSASKGRALAVILRALGAPASACAAFGDGQNDIDMLSMVGRPFVMSGASPALRAALPGAPLSGSNDDAGVARTLRELLGLPR